MDKKEISPYKTVYNGKKAISMIQNFCARGASDK